MPRLAAELSNLHIMHRALHKLAGDSKLYAVAHLHDGTTLALEGWTHVGSSETPYIYLHGEKMDGDKRPISIIVHVDQITRIELSHIPPGGDKPQLGFKGKLET